MVDHILIQQGVWAVGILFLMGALFYLVRKLDNESMRHFCKVELDEVYATQCNFDNKIDAARVLSDLNKIGYMLADVLLTYDPNSIEYFMGTNLKNRYGGSKSIRETNPDNKYGDTSYTLDKGSILSMCLRSGSGSLEDFETLKFVYLHELTHIAANVYQHPVRFWELFRILLIAAEKAGLYVPIDYRLYNKKYCNRLVINYNPYYDNTLSRPSVKN